MISRKLIFDYEYPANSRLILSCIMDITCYKLENITIKKVENEIKIEDYNNNVDWIEIRSGNRTEAADYFTKQNLYDEIVRACIEHPEKLSSKDLMSCERDIRQLSDIIKDQYVGFGILASLSSAADDNKIIQKTSKIINGFEPMDKAMLRLEKKG